jgi:hypothetical protein
MDAMLFQRGLLVEVFVSSQGDLFLFLLSILLGHNTSFFLFSPKHRHSSDTDDKKILSEGHESLHA